MVFPPNPIPSADHPSVDPSDVFKADVPFDVKQSALSTKRHRWFDIRNIGSRSDVYSWADGLNPGDTMRVQFDSKPDWIIVSISGRTAATGRVKAYMGDPGGPFIRLGPHGKIVIPAPSGGIVTLTNEGTTQTFGTIVAVAGYTDPGVDITVGD